MTPMLAFVLRLVLCIALVLNGMGDVLAAARMQGRDVALHQAPATSAPAVTVAVGSCHEPPGEAMQSRADASDGHGAHGNGQLTRNTHPDDCCSPSGPPCECECMHVAHVVLPPSSRGGTVTPALPEPVHSVSRHVAPTLPDPIRPPIG